MVSVSIPSQAGILLAASRSRWWLRVHRSLNTLTGGHPLGGKRYSSISGMAASLNTLTGGHPLGGIDSEKSPERDPRLNTLTGGHPLGGRGSRCSTGTGFQQSQYPHRRASSWRVVPIRQLRPGGLVSIPSQAGILLAVRLIWPSGIPQGCLNTLTGGHPLGGSSLTFARLHGASLNTLTGGHPLGGLCHRTRSIKLLSSQYPHRRASSWRLSTRRAVSLTPALSQYPHRRASSWRIWGVRFKFGR